MRVWVLIEEDRGCGISVVGVFLKEKNANEKRLSRQYVYESEITDAPGNAKQLLQPD